MIDDDWLPLNEDLPDWVDALLRGTDPPGLAPGHIRQLREAMTIERFAVDHFDFRAVDGVGYRERNQAESADFDDATEAAVLTHCRDLGLVEPSRPRAARYGNTLILGGGYKSPQLRTAYAAELARAGTDLGSVYLLGSPRPLIGDPPEAPAVAYYAPSASDEFDLMVAAALLEFDDLTAAPVEFLCGCDVDTVICPAWRLRHLDFDDSTMPAQFTHERRGALADVHSRQRGSVLSASTSRPPYRPDTSDTFALWARVAQPAEGEDLLIVTTQVFVPFQRFDAYRRLYLEYGADIDVVGFGVDRGDRPQTTEYLLQETLSGIRSARRMMLAAAEALFGRHDD
ncbi:hypothetical protein L2K20_05450 [Mycobacterium sp. MBM]|nr:hypothetical protein [Mycobacterium sp. MBM]